VQPTIIELSKLGPLPSEDIALRGNLVDLVDKYADLIQSTQKPISDDEVRVLVRLFGPDDCFGVAWSMLHLIESAPGWPLADCVKDTSNEWVRRLKERAIRGEALPSE
jgi:hypothetical protein